LHWSRAFVVTEGVEDQEVSYLSAKYSSYG
jgi:hypothetical protein